MIELPALPCRIEDVPADHPGDITRCRVCGDVLRLLDPEAGRYVGADVVWGVPVPDEHVLPEVPRRRDDEDLEQWLTRKMQGPMLWALCHPDGLRFDPPR